MLCSAIFLVVRIKNFDNFMIQTKMIMQLFRLMQREAYPSPMLLSPTKSCIESDWFLPERCILIFFFHMCSCGSGLTQKVENNKMNVVIETEKRQDLFEEIKHRFLSFKWNTYMWAADSSSFGVTKLWKKLILFHLSGKI